MRIKIVTPVKAYISDYTTEEYKDLAKELSYTNTSVSFNISKLKKQRWFKANHPEKWQARYDELQKDLKKTLIFSDEGGKYIRPGSIPYIPFKTEVINLVEYPALKKFAWHKKPPYTPYVYQQESVEKLIHERHGAVSLCTGSGKGLILQMLTREMGLKTVITVPTKGIFLEVMEAFENAFGKAKVGAFGNGRKDIKKDITIAIGKSLTLIKPGSPEDKFFKNKQVLITDEAHTFGSSELDRTCHGALDNIPYRFFLSGTQTRGDGSVPLLQSIIGNVVHTMTTKDGIAGGFLSPLEVRVLTVNSSNPMFYKDDPAEMKREHFLYNMNVIRQAAMIANTSATKLGENTLILVEEIEQLALVAKELKVPFVYTHGNTTSKEDLARMGLEKTDMKEALDKFHRKVDGTMVLIGTENISIGVNTFAHNGINLQGGASEIGTKQGIIGRMVRITQKSKYAEFHKEKKVGKIWDFRINIPKDARHREGPDLLEKHLQKRISFYEETGSPIIEIDNRK